MISVSRVRDDERQLMQAFRKTAQFIESPKLTRSYASNDTSEVCSQPELPLDDPPLMGLVWPAWACKRTICQTAPHPWFGRERCLLRRYTADIHCTPPGCHLHRSVLSFFQGGTLSW